MLSIALNLSNRGSQEALPAWPSPSPGLAAPAAPLLEERRSSSMSMYCSSFAAADSSAAISATVFFRAFGDGTLDECSGCVRASRSLADSSALSTASRNSGAVVHRIVSPSNA